MADWNPQANEVFLKALDLRSPEERLAFLDGACAGDAGLRAQVESLLKASDQAGRFLESPASAIGATSAQPRSEQPGTVIGPYKLLEQIGEGGMGVVYMADQQRPVRRRVALKIIKPGMDTRQVIARFEAERQALALMDHPNIARVLDVGATESGRPYFVMELVRGVPITEYCDKNNLPVHERLDLFVQVCQAVQHAHQKGIIHRDIKPSNVLVTLVDGRPMPKVIDFGVAKAINQQLTEMTLFTNFAQMIGTPLYMSPEQAEMTSLDVDTRTDIYSMGVLLYELLTGTTPFDQKRLREAALDEIRRIIREEEPPKPSTRISTLGDQRTVTAAHRKVDSNRLSQLLRGDLDWIVMKSIEKDRTQRYETANALARDVQRYLANEPVEACPHSTIYRFRKFARRNRAAFTTVVLVAGALVAGTAVSTWQAVRAYCAERVAELAQAEAENQRKQAEANFQQARRAVDEYFTIVSEDKLLEVPGLESLRNDLMEAALRFYERFADQRTADPAALADLAITYSQIGEIYSSTDRNEEAVVAFGRSLDVVDRLLRDFPEAKGHHRRLGGLTRGRRDAQTISEMPLDLEAAQQQLERMIATWRKLADDHPDVASFQCDIASSYFKLGWVFGRARPVEALDAFATAGAILEKLRQKYPARPKYWSDLPRCYGAKIWAGSTRPTG